MTPRFRHQPVIVPALIIAAAMFLIPVVLHPGQHSDLTVHEWGTFTSVAGEDGSAVDWDVLGCKDDLPEFVNDFGYRGLKWRLRSTVRMETPVMYFYSPRAVDVQVKVAFHQGLITEWYPRAEYEIYQADGVGGSARRLAANLNGIDTSLRSVTGVMRWRDIHVRPGIAPDLPVESAASRYYAARDTDADPIAVGDQQEKFLFYRGVGRLPIPLTARLSGDGTIVVENRGRDPVPGVIVFENRAGRIGYHDAGTIEGTVTLDPLSLDGSLPKVRSDLEAALVARGLFPKEAHAMLETWHDSWFEEGSRLIYIMSSRAVDRILPLEVDPVPSATTRVFVGRIELVTPETRRTVAEALAMSDWSTLDRYGRFLDPILARIYSEGPAKARETERLLTHQQSVSAGSCCRVSPTCG